MPSGSEWEASDTNWSSWTEISEPEENCEASDGGNSGFRGTGRPCESRTRSFRRAENRIAAVSPPVPIFALCGKTGGAVCRPAGFGLRKYSIRIMEKLIRLLHEGNYSLVVAHGEIRTFSGRGVSDLYANKSYARSRASGGNRPSMRKSIRSNVRDTFPLFSELSDSDCTPRCRPPHRGLSFPSRMRRPASP